MIIGYARVFTTDQTLDAQLDALTAAGAARVFSETISGTAAKRPELQRMLDQLRDGRRRLLQDCPEFARSPLDLRPAPCDSAWDVVKGAILRHGGPH